jgi:peptidoglycan hydrolase CwlO-like protein
MRTCDDHSGVVVVYQTSYCPLCDAESQINDREDDIRTKDRQIDDLKDQITELEHEVEDQKGTIRELERNQGADY